MGFSIGSLIGAVAPILGGVFGGPVGAALGTAVGGILAPSPSAPSAFVGTTSSSVGPTITGGSGSTTLVGSAGLVPLGLRAGSFIAGLLSRASAAIGKRITRQGVVALSRDVGITTAASALALSAVEVAQIIASKPRRRRRGITASQISTTKGTLRRLDSLNRAISKACPPPARRRAAIRRK